MHVEGNKYNSVLTKLSQMLEAWQEDADQYEIKIHSAEKEGKPVAGMEVYHKKQLAKIDLIHEFCESSHSLITALQKEIDYLKSASAKPAIHQVNLFGERTLIRDLPRSPETLHAEQMEILEEILTQLKKTTP